ncbi:hypothetical protein M0811_08944 [Anaeramoeba ignava]|uniref:Uncharacterized protein n=1 Tax=Anaeramoeba ignava TaxID=1746090 RepID=A0A9Q0LI09_ANAIG|nr:hypothetical protein M0811_08944 [Anaeramoeba ignava]
MIFLFFFLIDKKKEKQKKNLKKYELAKAFLSFFSSTSSSLQEKEKFQTDFILNDELEPEFSKALLNKNSPAFFIHSFQTNVSFQDMNLCSDSLKILNTPNAGGNSIISETLSNEILFRSFNSKLLATEMEIIYYPTGKITDYAVKIHDTNFGVSVTRAMKYPPNSPYTEEDAKRLLKKKLEGVIASTKLAIKPKFKKQILHIWAINSQAAESLEKAYADIDPEIKSNTIVLVTIAENCDFIFWNSSQINNNHNNQNQNQKESKNDRN